MLRDDRIKTCCALLNICSTLPLLTGVRTQYILVRVQYYPARREIYLAITKFDLDKMTFRLEINQENLGWRNFKIVSGIELRKS
jgi:hypothetical protein